MAQRDLKSNFSSGGLLITRVLAIITIFIVLPLIIYTISSFFYEYRMRKQELTGDLHQISQEKVSLIQEFAAIEFNSLQFIGHLLSLQKAIGLQEVKEDKNAQAAFYLTLQNNRLVCSSSSDPSLMGEDFSPFVNISAIKNGQSQIFQYHKNIVFSQSVGSEKTLNLAFDAQQFFTKLPGYNLANSSIFSVVIGQNHQVIAASHASLLNRFVRIFTNDLNDGPLFSDSSKAYFAVEMPINAKLTLITAMPRESVIATLTANLKKISLLLLCFLVFGGFFSALFMRRITRPFKQLCRVMQKVGQGNLHSKYKTDRWGFEINELGKIFNQMIDHIFLHIEKAKEFESQKKVLERELSLGQEVQQSILPKEYPDLPQLDIATYFHSAKEVGGDFYDIMTLSYQKIMFCIADTSDKGIFACLYSLIFRSALRTALLNHLDLARAIQQANEIFLLDTQQSGVFVTAWIGIYDISSGALTYASCGHPPALLKNPDQSWSKLHTNNMALGVAPLRHITVNQRRLVEGQAMILYTDGITEAFNDRQEMFGEKRLQSLLSRKNFDYSKQYIETILQAVRRFSQQVPQSDDVTLLSLIFKHYK